MGDGDAVWLTLCPVQEQSEVLTNNVAYRYAIPWIPNAYTLSWLH